MWDTTCPDTYILSHVSAATREAGAETGEEHSKEYLLQRIAFAVQKGNAAAVLRTF